MRPDARLDAATFTSGIDAARALIDRAGETAGWERLSPATSEEVIDFSATGDVAAAPGVIERSLWRVNGGETLFSLATRPVFCRIPVQRYYAGRGVQGLLDYATVLEMLRRVNAYVFDGALFVIDHVGLRSPDAPIAAALAFWITVAEAEETLARLRRDGFLADA